MRPTDHVPHTIGTKDDAINCIAGAEARRANKSQDCNPHEKGTAEYSQWAAGWRRPGMYTPD